MSARPARVALAAVLLLSGCDSGPDAPAPPRMVVVIGVDTLRADALGCYGAAGDPSPVLDRLAAEGARFADVTTAAPWTLPSFASLFTGLYPEAHGVTRNDRRLADGFVTLAERLAAHGYRTAAFTAGGHVGERNGLADGFTTFDPLSPTRKFKDRVPAALDWIDRQHGAPCFVFLHAYDVHMPYSPAVRPAPPAGYEPPQDALADKLLWRLEAGQPLDVPVGRVQTAYLTLDHVRVVDFRKAIFRWSATLDPPLEVQWPRTPDYAAELAWIRANYAAEVREADAELGRFLDHLRDRGRLDDALVVVVSDHGEAFMEHDLLDHGHVDQEVAHVPLLVRPPVWFRRQPPTVIAQPVSTVDVLPTILDYCGLPPAVPCQGRSLRPLIDGGRLPERPVACFQHVVGRDQAPEIAVRLKDWKLVTGGARLERTGGARLHHLGQDPGERRNLIAVEPEPAEKLRRLLASLRAECRRIALTNDPGAAPLDDAAVRELTELGYLGQIETDR